MPHSPFIASAQPVHLDMACMELFSYTINVEPLIGITVYKAEMLSATHIVFTRQAFANNQIYIRARNKNVLDNGVWSTS